MKFILNGKEYDITKKKTIEKFKWKENVKNGKNFKDVIKKEGRLKNELRV